jgi:hypothetical protein
VEIGWRRFRAALAGVLVSVLWGAVGCAGDLVVVTKGQRTVFRNRALDYHIDAPVGREEGRWVRVDVDGTDLAFRNDGATMTLLSRCRTKPGTPLMVLARHLVFGLGERDLRQAGPAQVDGLEAWTQTFDARREGKDVLIKTVTARRSDCVFDWVLVAPDPSAAREESFDRWWESWRSGPTALADREAESGALP